MKVSDKAPILNILEKNENKENNFVKPDLKKIDDIEQKKIMVLHLNWLTWIIKMLLLIVVFLFNLFIELIGIKKK